MTQRLAEAMMGGPAPPPPPDLNQIANALVAHLDGRGPAPEPALIDAALAPRQPSAPPAGGNRTWRNVAAAGEIALGALPFTRLGRAMFATVPRAAASAAGLGGAVVGAEAMARPAEAAEPAGELQSARDTIATLRERQAEMAAERKRLAGERVQFDRIDSSNTAAVKDAQRLLGLNPDGNWGPRTSEAIARHKLSVESQIQALDAQAARLGKDIEAQEGRLQGLEGGERLRRSEEEAGPFSHALRKYGEIGGTALGLGLGAAGRVGTVWKANRKAAERARLVESMLGEKRTAVGPRVGRLSEVWRQGGAPPGGAPFIPAPGTQYGAAVNPAATPSSALFPGRPGFRGQFTGTDAAIMGGAGVDIVVAERQKAAAQHELAEAQKAAERDPSALNIDRLQRAKDDVAFWQSVSRLGQAGALGYGVTATKAARHYPRPDLSRADAEMANLTRLIHPPKPPPRKRTR